MGIIPLICNDRLFPVNRQRINQRNDLKIKLVTLYCGSSTKLSMNLVV